MNFVSDKWKTLSKKLLFKNKYIALWEDVVGLPNGKKATYYVLRKEPFSIAIPYQNGKFYLVRQYRYSVSSLSLEFPMGNSEGKSPIETVIAELKEETGITGETIVELGKFWYGVGKTNQEAYVYLVKNLTFGSPKPDEGEFLQTETYNFDEIGSLIKNREILDAQTIVAYHYLEEYLKENTI